MIQLMMVIEQINWLAFLIQFGLASFGLTAVYCSMVSDKPVLKKAAPYIGLMAQPFWLYSAYSTKAWGMLIVCSCYTLIYFKAVFKHRRGL